jgi:hypothetical protein
MTRDRVWNKKRLNELKDRDWKRKEGWISQPASEEEKRERVELAFKVWNHEAHQKKLRGEVYDDWNPDEWAQIGEKRKNTGEVKDLSPERKVGKTFEVPQDESDEEDMSMVVTPTPSRVILEPRTVKRTSPSRKSNLFSSDVEMTENSIIPLTSTSPSTSPKRTGRTFELDYDKYDEDEPNSPVKNGDIMSITSDGLKPVGLWTPEDFTNYLKENYSFDPVQLATEVKNMEHGQMPSQLMQAFRAIQDIRARATSELQHEMYQKRQDFEADLDDIRQKKLKEGLLLIKEYEDLLSKREAVRGYYNGETLAANVRGAITPSENKYSYPYVEASPPFTPENPSLALAESNSTSNVENIIPTWDDIHRERVQPRSESNKQASVSWAQNTVYNHGIQGPNEPSQPDTPHPKPALKGSQLESFERKKSEATRYTPKQPSRLREVSDNERLKANALSKALNPQSYQPTSDNIFEQSLKASKPSSSTSETSESNGRTPVNDQPSKTDQADPTSADSASGTVASTSKSSPFFKPSADQKSEPTVPPAETQTTPPSIASSNTLKSSSQKPEVNGLSSNSHKEAYHPGQQFVHSDGEVTTVEIVTSLGPIFSHLYPNAPNLPFPPLSEQEKAERNKQAKLQYGPKVGLWGTTDPSPWVALNEDEQDYVNRPPFEGSLWGSSYNKTSEV